MVNGLVHPMSLLTESKSYEGKKTYPEVIVALKVDLAAGGQSGALVGPGTDQVGSLPDADLAAGFETEVGTVIAANNRRVVTPALARAGAGVAVRLDGGAQQRSCEGEDGTETHDDEQERGGKREKSSV